MPALLDNDDCKAGKIVSEMKNTKYIKSFTFASVILQVKPESDPELHVWSPLMKTSRQSAPGLILTSAFNWKDTYNTT